MFPEFIEKILTWIFGERRLVEVVLYPYTGCDVICRHCSDVEKFTNQTMTVELVDRLLKQAKWSWCQLVVVVMGTGEPLLCKNFVPIMDRLLSSPLVNIVKLVTSGFTKEEKVKKGRFEELIDLDGFAKCIVTQSFNLYHPTFPERMKNIIETILARHSKCMIKVGMAVSKDNAEKTMQVFAQSLKTVDIGEAYDVYPVVIGKEVLDEEIVERQMQAIQRQQHGIKNKYLSLLPQIYVIKGETKKIGLKVMPFPVESVGRGKCISEEFFSNSRCDTFRSYPDMIPSIYIGPDGECYPDINCFNVPQMKLGNINKEKLSVILASKEELLISLIADVLQHPDKNLSICEAHQAACRQRKIR